MFHGFAYQLQCVSELWGSKVRVTVLVFGAAHLLVFDPGCVFWTDTAHSCAADNSSWTDVLLHRHLIFTPTLSIASLHFCLSLPGGPGTNRHQAFSVCHPAAAGMWRSTGAVWPSSSEWKWPLSPLGTSWGHSSMNAPHVRTYQDSAGGGGGGRARACVWECVLLYGSQKDTETICWDRPAEKPGQQTSARVPSCKELFTECVNCCWLCWL